MLLRMFIINFLNIHYNIQHPQFIITEKEDYYYT